MTDSPPLPDPPNHLPPGAADPEPPGSPAPPVATEPPVPLSATPEAPPLPTSAPPPSAPAAAPRGRSDGGRSDFGRRAVVSVVATVCILAAGGGLFRGLLMLRRPPERQATTPPLTAVRVQSVQREEVDERLTGYGRARALRAGDVSAEVAGRVIATAPECEAGQAVAAGTELVRLDPRDLESARLAAAARLAQAQAALQRVELDRSSATERVGVSRQELAIAERELERLQQLDAEAVSPSQIDLQRLQVSQRRHALLELERQVAAAGPGVAQAEAEVSAATAGLARATLDCERAVIRAPYAGRLRTRFVQEGQRVAPGTPVFHLVDPTRVEVPVALPARHYGEVQPGAAMVLREAADAAPLWRGTVARVAPAIDDADRTFFVYAVVTGPTPGADAPVAPGAFVIGEVAGVVHRDVIAVPRAAFVGEACFVARPSHVVVWIASEVPGQTPEERAARRTTLTDLGERIRAVLGGVAGCGPAEPPVVASAVRVVAPITGSAAWEALAASAREAIRAAGAVADGVRVTVGVEASVEERHPTVTRRLPEVALVQGALEPGEQLIVTNLERVATGGRVRLVSDVPEQVSAPRTAAAGPGE